MAAGRARKGRTVNGLLLLNKPAGITSNRALQTVKRWLGARKAGHTGSLDPAATGMLPLCFGEATKISAFLLDADKTYRVVADLGTATDTGDADGRPVRERAVPEIDVEGWRDVLDSFLGESQQVPPMYSALKQQGTRLYELARQGQVVERPPRTVRIEEIALLEARGRRLVFRVRCSKGTYVRTLVEDLAEAVGTVAHTAFLHRERVGPFRARDMVDFAELEALAEQGPEAVEQHLLPADSALADWPEVTLDAAAAEAFCSGQSVAAGGAAGGLLRVYAGRGRFLGIGAGEGGGRVAPRRVFRPDPEA